MNARKSIVLSAFVCVAGMTSIYAQTADEIMAKHINAVGGMDKWESIKTMKMDGSLIQQGMEISLKQTIVANKAQRTDISVMGMSGFSIVTQNAGYKYMPFMGATKIDTMKADEIKMNQNQLNPKTVQMLDYAANGTKVELAGKDTINNQACYKIKCTNKEGENSFCYIDMNNYYLIRIEKNARIQGEDQEVAVVFNNYTKLPEGVVMPMSMTAQGVEITYKSIELNKPVDDKIFVPTIEK